MFRLRIMNGFYNCPYRFLPFYIDVLFNNINYFIWNRWNLSIPFFAVKSHFEDVFHCWQSNLYISGVSQFLLSRKQFRPHCSATSKASQPVRRKWNIEICIASLKTCKAAVPLPGGKRWKKKLFCKINKGVKWENWLKNERWKKSKQNVAHSTILRFNRAAA